MAPKLDSPALQGNENVKYRIIRDFFGFVLLKGPSNKLLLSYVCLASEVELQGNSDIIKMKIPVYSCTIFSHFIQCEKKFTH